MVKAIKLAVERSSTLHDLTVRDALSFLCFDFGSESLSSPQTKIDYKMTELFQCFNLNKSLPTLIKFFEVSRDLYKNRIFFFSNCFSPSFFKMSGKTVQIKWRRRPIPSSSPPPFNRLCLVAFHKSNKRMDLLRNDTSGGQIKEVHHFNKRLRAQMWLR